MGKAANKTQQTTLSPEAFIAGIESPRRKADAETLLVWFGDVTGLKPKMWGPSIIGYGRYHYKYESGREGDMLMTGFSPRKASLVLYIMPGHEGMDALLARLGKHKTGAGCLYINTLADVDMDVLREMVEEGVAHMRATYETWDE
ncbi:DUF1801 domain-containing protein [Hyphomonas chukchiensis]|uniref:YdhG-like domain-containing protein n=1 Tax=Hyphomonas chukchiensis TaxID=1280947 RepID=A0A062UR29_9PROT|nr:DUF1801 domain-containing protein [Hyphomonas chukchiensis]KCZ60608.1 hypothetical protein HY30_11590 [Hyphomonas chukchiensis]